MKTISRETVVGIIVLVALGVLAGTAEAVMVSGWEPVEGNVMTLTFSDDAGNTVIGSIRKAIYWELGTEAHPKFVQWDETATFILKTKDGKEKPLPNAEVKKRIKTIYGGFSPAGKLTGNLAKLDTTQARDQARAAIKDANIAAAQDSLRALGYDPGPSDGIAGGKTRSALRAYQRDKGLTESGFLDEATAAALGVSPSPMKPPRVKG